MHAPSRIVAADGFPWTDGGWRGVPRGDLVIYELHVGTFSPEGTFAGVAARLPYLRDLGVTAVELMPVAAFPGDRNWGYDGVYLYAPHTAYGGPDGLKRLVDACHAHGLALILDVVYNHLGPEGNYLGDYGPYFTDRYRTPVGRRAELRRRRQRRGAALLRRQHLALAAPSTTSTGLRLDAIQGISRLLRASDPARDRRRVSRRGRAPRPGCLVDRGERSQRPARDPAEARSGAWAWTRSGATTSTTRCTRS